MFLSYFIHPACTRASFSFLEWLPLQTLLVTLLVLGHSNGNTHLLYNRSWRGHPLSVSRRRPGNLREIKGRGAIQPGGFSRRSMAFRRRQPSSPLRPTSTCVFLPHLRRSSRLSSFSTYLPRRSGDRPTSYAVRSASSGKKPSPTRATRSSGMFALHPRIRARMGENQNQTNFNRF